MLLVCSSRDYRYLVVTANHLRMISCYVRTSVSSLHGNCTRIWIWSPVRWVWYMDSGMRRWLLGLVL